MDEKIDNRPRGKGSKGPYKKTEPDSPIPEVIKLPDGRQFSVKELIKKRTGSRNYNLLNPENNKLPRGFVGSRPIPQPKQQVHILPDGSRSKYSIEEREWQAEATVKQIAERYEMNLKTASVTRYNARKMFKTQDTETGYIIDHTQSNGANKKTL